MLNKKRVVCGALPALLVASIGLTGCSQPAGSTNSGSQPAGETGEKPVIEFYHGYFQSEEEWPTAQVMRDIYDEFAEAHKDEFTFKPIAVETGSEGVQTQCTQEIANGSFPDIVDLGGMNCIPAAQAAGVVLDLKPYLDEDETFKKNVGVNYEQNQLNGGIYSIKEQIESVGFWYNEDLFTAAGAALPSEWQTWDDFDTAVDKLLASDAVETPFTLTQGWSTNLLFAGHLMSTADGRNMLSAEVPDFSNDAFKGTVEFMTTNALQKIGNEFFTPDDDTYRQNFLSGKSAMLFNGVWDASSFGEDADNIKPAVFPTSEAGKKAALVSAGAGLTVSSQLSEEETAACIEFIKYMTSEEVAERIFTEGLAMPASDSFDYSKYLNDENPAVSKLAEACMLVQQADYKNKTMGAIWGGDVEASIAGKYAGMKDGSKTADDVINEMNSIVAE